MILRVMSDIGPPPSTGTAVAAADLVRLLERPTAMPLRAQDAVLLEGTECFRFGPDQSRVAWRVGEGPLVLMVHGWGGRGTQMAGMAHMLAAEGFQSVFFDAGGHGESRPEPVGFRTFIDDTSALTQFIGKNVHAWIGHSAGGLGMMSARAQHGLKADRYVCIAAPLSAYIPIESLRKNTGASDEVLDLIKPYLSRQFDSTWDSLEAGSAYGIEPDKPLLLIYDVDDDRTRHTDADHIAAKWPGAKVLKTSGYGHNRVLQDPTALQCIREFI
jgi:hypothetical protein